MTEDKMRELFTGNDREIESIKMFPVDREEKAYAFVCFKTPDQAQTALN
jgi:RNA recognition motif-containing protein